MQQQELFAGYGDGSFTLCMEQATSGYMLGGADEKYPDREEKHIFPVEINGEVPKQALSMGVAEILDAKHIVLIAEGAGKKDILKKGERVFS